MSNLELIVALEEAFPNRRPRGTCTACGFDVPLTLKGYVKSHAYFEKAVDGKRIKTALFSWKGVKEKHGTVVIHCYGSGNRPRRGGRGRGVATS